MLEFRPSPEFSYESGKYKLINLRLFANGSSDVSFITPGDNDPCDNFGDATSAGHTDCRGQTMRLASSIDIESRLTIGCAGALLTYMARRKAIRNLPDSFDANNSFCICTVEMFSLRDMM